jgi:hypothetical protein
MDEMRRFAKAGGKLVDGRRDLGPLQLYGRVVFTSSSVAGVCLGFGLNPEIAFLGVLGVSALVVLVVALSHRA